MIIFSKDLSIASKITVIMLLADYGVSQEKLMKNRAFTSVELSVCLLVLGGTAAVLYPVFATSNHVTSSKLHLAQKEVLTTSLYSSDSDSLKQPPQTWHFPFGSAPGENKGLVDCPNPGTWNSFANRCEWTGTNVCTSQTSPFPQVNYWNTSMVSPCNGGEDFPAGIGGIDPR